MSTDIVVIVVCAVWAVCGPLVYAKTLAYMTREFPLLTPTWRDVAFAAGFGVLGPIGIIVIFISGDMFKHGLRWRI